jgi:N-methylhydantoinase A
MDLRVGIDIGGTFTDLVFLAPDGTLVTTKVLSTPQDYSVGIVNGLSAAFSDHGVAADSIGQLMHGTTVATNAILEGKGARVALITTEGFRDVLEIRRLRMPALYDIRWRKPPTLIPRRLRFEVPERVDYQGRIVRPLDEDTAGDVIASVLAHEVDALAVCLINSYVNGAHERRIRDLVRARAPDLPVSISSELVPEIKEYERTSTTAVNAYVLPVVKTYLGRLAAALQERRIAAPLKIMQSNGGVMSAAAASERPYHIIESGPAAGVVGAAELARLLRNASLLTFDMGGTTAKAALVENGHFHRVSSLDVGGGINLAGRLLKGGGYHVSAPAIDIAEVGAGGGSIVRLDAGGALRVGPDSAGSSPGPVCYGRGGTTATVTDANVVLGIINSKALAARVVDEQVATPLGLTVEEAAWGIHRVANAAMARALRAVSTERGLDPRPFALMAFGGNGPVHAATLAALLGLRRILVPPIPGLFSSLGMLFPDVEHHFVRTFKRVLDGSALEGLAGAFASLESRGRAALVAEQVPDDAMLFTRFVDLRYAGANSELSLPYSAADGALSTLLGGFAEAHERQFGYRSPEETVELVNVRLIARGGRRDRNVPHAITVASASAPSERRRAVYFGEGVGRLSTPVIGRTDLPESWMAGPVLIDEYDSTTLVPPNGRVRRIAWNVIEIEFD